MRKTAMEHIETAEQMLADVERQAHHGVHEKVMECIRLHLELADTIIRVEAHQRAAPPETNSLMASVQKINAEYLREQASIKAEYLREKDNWAGAKNN